ncbi:MAG: ATP-dependent zinc protease [Amphiplicatus sp.]
MDTRSIFDAPAPKKRRRKKAPPAVAGWREWAAFPALGVERIKAKLDTGAKTSAIHAFKVKSVMREDGTLWAEFFLHPVQKRRRPEIFCAAPIVDRRRIKSSNGKSEERIVVRTTLRLGEKEWPIELSLTNRDEMGFRLLIGRDALRRRFIVDPSASFLLGK